MKGIIVLLDIINYYSIIIEVNLELRGFTIFTKRTLLLHDVYGGNSGVIFTFFIICSNFMVFVRACLRRGGGEILFLQGADYYGRGTLPPRKLWGWGET